MKSLRNFIIFFISMIISFYFMILEPSYAATHEITHIDIQVTLHADGSARIIEKRRAYFSEGTENFIVIGHLGKSRIKDFIVKEERSEEHTSELQSRGHLVCRLLLEK